MADTAKNRRTPEMKSEGIMPGPSCVLLLEVYDDVLEVMGVPEADDCSRCFNASGISGSCPFS